MTRLTPRSDPLRPLVDRTLEGDRGALDQLLRRVGPSILRAARGVLGADHPDVQDALQDGMMRFVDALPQWRGDCSVLHYAVRIALRAATDAVRKSERRGRLRDAVRFGRGTESAPPPQRRVLQRELLGRILTETLSPVQVEALMMKVALGYTLDEIAEATGVPRNTVRSRLLHGRNALRARLEEDEGLDMLLGEEA